MDIGRRSRSAYNLQCMLEYFASLLITDAFLAKLLRSLGMSDALNGIVSSLITFSFLGELLFFPALRRTRNVKRTVILLDAASMTCFALAFLLPVVPASDPLRCVLVILLIICGYLSGSCISSMYFVWANSFVAPERRARFSALKEMMSLMGGILFTLAMGVLFDKLEAEGRTVTAFLITAGMILLVNILSVFCLLRIGPAEKPPRAEGSSLAQLKKVIQNRSFMNVVLMSALWCAARFFSTGFLGVYKTGELALSVGLIQLINMIGNLSRFAFSLPFGAYSDRTSYTRGFRLSMLLAAGAFAANLFTVKSTWWLTIVYSVLMCVSFAGNNANLVNISYSYVEKDLLVPAMMLKNGVCGIASIVSSLLGGLVMDRVQRAGNTVLGIPINGMQVLSLLSLLMTVAVILFCRFVVEKQPVLKQ